MAMAIIPRPVSPRSMLEDIKPLFAKDRPYRWKLLLLSATITGVMLWAFYLETRPPVMPPQIIYVESWMANRKDSDIIRQQLKDLAGYEAAIEQRQKAYQKVADLSGIEWRKEAEKNKQRRLAVITATEKALKARLAAALKHEAAQKAAATNPAP